MEDCGALKINRTVVQDRFTEPILTVQTDEELTTGLLMDGLRSDITMDSRDCCLGGHKTRRTYGTVRSSGHVRKPLFRRPAPVVKRSIPIRNQKITSEVMEIMHYQWISRNSISDRPVPCIFLEIPEHKFPGLLQLAKEAREMVGVNGSSGFLEDIQFPAVRLGSPTIVEIMPTGHRLPSGGCSVYDEVRPDADDHDRRIESQISGGQYTNGIGRQDPYEERGSDLGFSPVNIDWSNDCVVSRNSDVTRTEREGLVDQRMLTDSHNVSDPLVRFVPRPDRIEGSEGGINSPGIRSHGIDSVSSGRRIDQPVVAGRKVYTQAGPLGFVIDVDDCLTNRQDSDVLYRTDNREDRHTDVIDDSPTQAGNESMGLQEIGSSDIRTGYGFQKVQVNGKLDSQLAIASDVSRSSDSGVHSWTEQWENMSDVSMNGSYDDTGNTVRGITEEMSGLIFVAPPNSEVESDSDSDVAVLSDFSDDSSILGIRKVLRRRVPYRGRAPPPKKGCAPAPRTPPVQARNSAERWQYEWETTRAQWSRWQYGPPLDRESPLFERFVRTLTGFCLDDRHDPRHDRYYPRLVRSLAKAGRVVRTVPRCRENHRRRRDLMMRLFDEDMEQRDVVLDRFPDRHVHRFMKWFPMCASHVPPKEPVSTVVMGTHTPPILRKRYRKYAALRAFETDVDDYFGNSTEEWQWTARSVSWYQS